MLLGGKNRRNARILRRMRVLITGTSGTGKSTIAAALRNRGHQAIETDYEHYIAYWEHVTTGQRVLMPEPIPTDWFATHHWKWDADTLGAVLERFEGTVFVCGDSRNKADAFELFDKMFVLRLDDAALIERLTRRTNNPYGKAPEEREWAVADNAATVDQLVRAGATVIDAALPVDNLVDNILAATQA